MAFSGSQTTALSTLGVPGRVQSFIAKTEAATIGPACLAAVYAASPKVTLVYAGSPGISAVYDASPKINSVHAEACE